MATTDAVLVEVQGVCRKISKFLTYECPIPSAVEHRNVWEVMTYDRSFTASVLVCLVAKMLSFNSPDAEGANLIEVVGNLLQDRPLVVVDEKAVKTALSVKMDLKRYVQQRMAILNTIYYVILNYPFDVNHPAIKIAFDRWSADIVENGLERDFAFENEVLRLVHIVESDQNITDLVFRCSNLNVGRDEVQNVFNSGFPASNRVLADSLILPYLVSCMRRNEKADFILRCTASQLVGGNVSLSESQFTALIMMLREFLLTNPPADAESLNFIRESVRPYYVWPTPHAQTAAQLMKYCDFLKRSHGVACCLHFLEHHQNLLAKTSDLKEHTHILCNERSFQGSAIKELLQEMTTAFVSPEEETKIRCRFIYYAFHMLLPEDSTIYSLVGVENALIQSLFDRVAEIVVRASKGDTGQINAFGLNTLKNLKKEAEEAITLKGNKKEPILPTDINDYGTIGTLPGQILEIDEGAFNITDRTVGSNELPLPDVGAFATLTKILSQYTEFKRPVTVKLVVVGGDATLHNVVCAYVGVRHVRPDLFNNVTPMFYFIPAGRKNRFANTLGLLDPWYGRQVLIHLKSILMTIPSMARLPYRKPQGLMRDALGDGSQIITSELREIFKARDAVKNQAITSGRVQGEPRHKQPILGNSPSMTVRSILEHYLRTAAHPLQVRIYQVEVWIQLNTGVLQRRIVPFMRGLELGNNAFAALQAYESDPSVFKTLRRNSGAVNKPVKFLLPEVSIKLTEVNVGGAVVQSATLPQKAYYSIQLSNLPRNHDQVDVVNPATNCLELSLLDPEIGRRVARGKAQGGIDEGPVYYVSSVEIEDASQAKRTFEIIVDDYPIGHVTKFKVQPMKDPINPVNADGQENPLVMPTMLFSKAVADY